MLNSMRVVPALLTLTMLAPTHLGELESAGDAAVPIAASPQARPLIERDPRAVVKGRASRSGWIGTEWRCLETIIDLESRWDPKAANKHSTARGLFQMLNQKPNLPVEDQARLGLRYVRERYGSPCKALTFHVKHGYY